MSLAFFRRTVNRRVWKTLFNFFNQTTMIRTRMCRCIRWNLSVSAGCEFEVALKHFASHNYIINLIVRSQPSLDDIPRVFPSPASIPKAAKTGSSIYLTQKTTEQIPTRCNYSREMLCTRRTRRRRGVSKRLRENLSSWMFVCRWQGISVQLIINHRVLARKERN